MRNLAAGLSAGVLALAAASNAHAVVYTGVLSGDPFSEFLPVPAFESRPLRIDFEADMTKVDWAFLTVQFLNYFTGTDDNGLGQPRTEYGDSYETYDDYSSFLTPTGFSLLIDTPDNATCNPYKGPAYFCEHVYLDSFYLDGAVLSEPVPYVITITAVPEPAAWAIMIAGFGLAGGALRWRRARFA